MTETNPATSDLIPSNAGYWHVRVSPKSGQLDSHGRDVLVNLRQAGFSHIEVVRTSRFYFFHGTLHEDDIRLLASGLLADPVAEKFSLGPGIAQRSDAEPAVEIRTLPGVMNPVAMSALDAARRLLQSAGHDQATIDAVQTSRRYGIVGAGSAEELERIAAQALANDCIETWYVDGLGRQDEIPDAFAIPPVQPFELRHVPLRNMDDKELAKLSRDGHLFLSLAEMQAVRDHFQAAGHDPTDLELETLAQTWSEHCVHKTLKSSIEYRGDDFGRAGQVEVSYDNLLKETIMGATTKLNRDWCLSVFVDNAGVIAFDDEYAIAFKAETHNHPSAIEPYGGAATGIGGCIRDIMGCGLGAKPIASTDVFCLARPDFDPKKLPTGVLHPRRILKGVVGGVRDYGNRMGIPTVNGAVYFDDRYLGNPLVFCGCIGLIPKKFVHKQPRAGDLIVVAGGRTGRDGIHGATFSSAELTHTHANEFSHAVQIGHAIEEKKVLDAMLTARDHAEGCLYSAVTDCGAGGLSSAVGEMGETLGARVDLENVPLKYSGLRYDEIWISEAQERMVFAVAPNKIEKFVQIFHDEEVEASVIGTFTGDGVLHVLYQGTTVGRLDMAFLHHGLPKQRLTARWNRQDNARVIKPHAVAADTSRSVQQRLLDTLGQLNVASKEWIIRQYDHEVQGRSVVKPLVGPGSGPSDAAVLRPRYDSDRGIAIACGLCPQRGDDDPYWMAVAAIDEALRNVICVGADPMRIAILDNFCWPKVDNERSLGALVRTCRGAYDAAVAFGLPFVSGKDSLNNEFSMSPAEAKRTGLPERIAIPYTLLVSSLGIVEDVNQCVTLDLKQPGNVLVLASAPVEHVGLDSARKLHHQVAGLIRSGKVRSAHDVSDGGLAVTVAEMCIAANLGASVKFSSDSIGGSMFGEPCTTYVLEMDEAHGRDTGWPTIGRVIQEAELRIESDEGDPVKVSVDQLARAWRDPLAKVGG